MLDFLFESPLTIGSVGGVLSIAAFYFWIQTGLKPLLYSSIAVVLVTLLLVAVGIFVDTDREALRRFVFETASELEANESQKVVGKIHPQASNELQEIRRLLPEIRFQAARVKAIHQIDIKRHRTGVNATITMNVYVEVEYGDRRGRAPRAARLTLEQVDGRWMIVDFEQDDPRYYLLNDQGRQRMGGMRP
jgi:hypothetical protein